MCDWDKSFGFFLLFLSNNFDKHINRVSDCELESLFRGKWNGGKVVKFTFIWLNLGDL